MSRCLIVFFSQTKTTETMAQSIAKGLRAAGHGVDLHNLKDSQPPDPVKYDVLGIGCPTHYYRVPVIMTDYLERLPALSGKSVFTFVLCGSILGDTGNIIRGLLEKKGGKETGYARYFGAGSFLGYLKQGYQFSPNQPKPDAIAHAEQYGREIAARLAGKAYIKEDRDSRPRFIYRLERFLTQPLLARQMYSRQFMLDRKKCNSCGACIRLCPTKNLSEDGKGMPVWGRSCMICFMCEMKCPKDAINSRATWFMFWPFMAYNVRAAAKLPGIEHVRVTHAKGVTSVIKA